MICPATSGASVRVPEMRVVSVRALIGTDEPRIVLVIRSLDCMRWNAGRSRAGTESATSVGDKALSEIRGAGESASSSAPIRMTRL